MSNERQYSVLPHNTTPRGMSTSNSPQLHLVENVYQAERHHLLHIHLKNRKDEAAFVPFLLIKPRGVIHDKDVFVFNTAGRLWST